MKLPSILPGSLAAFTTGLLLWIGTAWPVSAALDLTTFAPPLAFSTDQDPGALMFGDLDGDGKLDMVVVNYQSSTLGLYRNTSTAGSITEDSFAAAVTFATGANPAWLALADLDRDGKLDVVVANDYGSSISLFQNTTTSGPFDGTSLGPRVNLVAGTHPVGLAIADFDGDGWPDIAVVNAVLGPSSVGIYRNLGAGAPLDAGSFAPMVEFATGDYSFKVTAGDLDGDGQPDLVVANISSHDVSLLRNISVSGEIHFADRIDLPTAVRNFESALGDLNGDGKSELIVVHDGGVSVYPNQATAGELSAASFGEPVVLPIGGTAYEAELADFDGDNDLDLAVTVLGQQGVSVFANRGTSGAITPDFFGPKLDYGNDGNSLAVGDLDGDGRVDLATCHRYRISTYWNTGTLPTPPQIVSQPQSRGAMPGQSVTFQVGAIGTEPLFFQWLFNGEPIEGADQPSYAIADVQVENDGAYSVRVSNELGTQTSREAQLRVVPGGSLAEALDNNLDWVTGGSAPWVAQFGNTHDGEDAAAAGLVCCGEISTLSTTVEGPVTLSFWWRFSRNRTSYSSLSFYSSEERIWLQAESGQEWQQVRLTLSQGTHSLRWTFYQEGIGDQESGRAWLDEVNIVPLVDERPPFITAQPVSQIRFVGGEAQFEVQATGAPDLTYQWFFNDAPLEGATESRLTLSNVQPEQAGLYRAEVTNPFGTARSSVALLTVRTPMPIPTILSITPTAGPPQTQVTIAGQNFSADPLENVVYFGATRAEVVSASSETLQVLVPLGATFAPLTVTVHGYVAWSPQWFVPTSTGSGDLAQESFAPTVNFLTGADPSWLAVGDLDGDGKPEMLTVNYQSGTVGIYRNISTAGSIEENSFAAPVSVPTPADPACIAVGDLNNDGKLDVVVANDYGANISIFENLSTAGSISLGPRIDLPAGTHPVGLVIADFDGDGWSDIAVANADWEQSDIGIYQNLGTGAFNGQSFSPMARVLTGYYTFKCNVGDLDGDGKPDLVAANIVTGDVSILRNESTPGFISFAPAVSISTRTRNFECAIGDLDGDGKAELVVVHDGGVSIFKNQAMPGAFTQESLAEPVVLETPDTAYEVELADLNGDAKLDLIVSVLNQPYVSVYQNRIIDGVISADSLEPKTELAGNGNSVAIEDLDGDGRPEVITCLSWRISVHQNILPGVDEPEEPEGGGPVRLSADAGLSRLSGPIYRNGSIHFTVEGAPAKALVIEASTDLVHWSTLTVVPDGSAGIIISDPVLGTLPQRFYRARLSQ